MELPARYLEVMENFLGQEDYENYKRCMKEKGVRGLRLNPLKVLPERRAAVLHAIFGEELEAVPWSQKDGYYYGGQELPAKHPYYYGGLYYLQEPSAMAPGALLPIEPGNKVLDLCAAPGGKSTQIGGRLDGKGFLLSNDISASRAKGLLKNLELFGIGNCLVSSEEPERLADCFPEYFDRVLVDAPCSGEGMFRREPSMAAEWNRRGPEYYAPIQRKLLHLAWQMLKPGGYLLYSTCTFSEMEDEENVSWLLQETSGAEQVVLKADYGFTVGRDEASARLFPWKVKGEGHFAALFRKKGTGDSLTFESGEIKERQRNNQAFLKKYAAFAWFREKIKAPLEERGFYWERQGELYLLPLSPRTLPPLRFLRTGLHLGTVKKERFEPSQALAMYLKKEEFSATVDFSSADVRTVKYLKGETVEAKEEECTGENGWCLVCTDGWPLGFAKRNGGSLKNKYYPGWRWK